MQFRAHLHTVNRHRRLVRRYCLKLGLVWQGLTHDLSKYSPTEFWRGCTRCNSSRRSVPSSKRETAR